MFSKVLTERRPDILLVHGDTSTTLAAAMAAFHAAGIRIGHVEAGLRTYDFNAPFPEEFNEQVTIKWLICILHRLRARPRT